MKPWTALLLFTCLSLSATAQSNALIRPDTVKSYTTAMVKGEPPHIDGLENDAAWEQVEWAGWVEWEG